MDVSKALGQLKEHTEKHSNNKYQNTVINIEASLGEPTFTLLTAEKYIARYLATSGEKRAQPIDLLKAAHFILFELQSRINADEAEATKNQVKISYDPIPYSQIGNIATKTLGLVFRERYSPKDAALFIDEAGIELVVNVNGSWSLNKYGTQVMFGQKFDYNDVDRIQNFIAKR
jgi:hypothetical protein